MSSARTEPMPGSVRGAPRNRGGVAAATMQKTYVPVLVMRSNAPTTGPARLRLGAPGPQAESG